MPEDWIGNKKATFAPLAANNHTNREREQRDFYASDPNAINILINDGNVKFSHDILEPHAGNGHLAKPLKDLKYNVVCKDIIERDYPLDGTWNFLEQNEKWHGDIVMNPPYRDAQKHIEKALNMINDGNKVYALLKIQFLEGKARRKLFNTRQLKTVYVFSSRILCAENGNFDKYLSSAVCYAWYCFEKGYNNDPVIKWIN